MSVDTTRVTTNWYETEVDSQVFRGICDVKSSARAVAADGTVNVDKHIAQLGQYELIQILAKQQTGYEYTLPAEIIALTAKAAQLERGLDEALFALYEDHPDTARRIRKIYLPTGFADREKQP